MTKTRTSGLSPFPSSQKKVIVTPYQERVYALLQQIPSGKITSYAALSRALNSSPRAVGGALRNNPFAPEIPCHRCIASTGYIGGFKGDWEKAPSGINCEMKLESLKEEGVEFDGRGMLLDRTCWWDDFKVKG
ncbi:DNA binding methylated-DNA--cysteine S-methyltransferase [Tothia fuscella]|uniref:Methylated-DNA--protein-cysteine methyltransferase n=1 Tax=Tothia fuscella TaxID=1048955 RepID=A0A9P4TW17_9PEZI|nr:DNA binding methylated-DNA--cysteine S-methyltransferase [Tothia fuscella]